MASGSSFMSSDMTSSFTSSDVKSDCVSSFASESTSKSQSENYSVPIVSRNFLTCHYSNDNRKKAQKWTKEEDLILTEAVKQLGDYNWKNIAACTSRKSE